MAQAKKDEALQAMDTKPIKPKKIGRPSVMTEAVRLEICARLSGGENLTHICKDPKMPNRATVTNYLARPGAENSVFVERYAIARERCLDVYADEILAISDDGTTDYIIKTGRNGREYEAVDQEHIQRSRLRVDSRKWLLSKLRPNEYGDKVITETTGTVTVKHDITSLSEREKMRRFALFMMEDNRQPAIEGEAKEVHAGTESQASEGHIMNSSPTKQADDVPM